MNEPDSMSINNLRRLDLLLQQLESNYPLRGTLTNADRLEHIEQTRLYIGDLMFEKEQESYLNHQRYSSKHPAPTQLSLEV